MKLLLDMASKHVFLYLCLPDYLCPFLSFNISETRHVMKPITADITIHSNFVFDGDWSTIPGQFAISQTFPMCYIISVQYKSARK